MHDFRKHGNIFDLKAKKNRARHWKREMRRGNRRGYVYADNAAALHIYNKLGFDILLFDGEDEHGAYVKLLKNCEENYGKENHL